MGQREHELLDERPRYEEGRRKPQLDHPLGHQGHKDLLGRRRPGRVRGSGTSQARPGLSKKMKNTAFLLVVVAAMTLAVSAQKKYTDKSHGFSFTYPSDFKVSSGKR